MAPDFFETRFQYHGSSESRFLAFPAVPCRNIPKTPPETVDHFSCLIVGCIPTGVIPDFLRCTDQQSQTVFADFHMVAVRITPVIPLTPVNRAVQTQHAIPRDGNAYRIIGVFLQVGMCHDGSAFGGTAVGITASHFDILQGVFLDHVLRLFPDIGIDHQISGKALRDEITVYTVVVCPILKWLDQCMIRLCRSRPSLAACTRDFSCHDLIQNRRHMFAAVPVPGIWAFTAHADNLAVMDANLNLVFLRSLYGSIVAFPILNQRPDLVFSVILSSPLQHCRGKEVLPL